MKYKMKDLSVFQPSKTSKYHYNKIILDLGKNKIKYNGLRLLHLTFNSPNQFQSWFLYPHYETCTRASPLEVNTCGVNTCVTWGHNASPMVMEGGPSPSHPPNRKHPSSSTEFIQDVARGEILRRTVVLSPRPVSGLYCTCTTPLPRSAAPPSAIAQLCVLSSCCCCYGASSCLCNLHKARALVLSLTEGADSGGHVTLGNICTWSYIVAWFDLLHLIFPALLVWLHYYGRWIRRCTYAFVSRALSCQRSSLLKILGFSAFGFLASLSWLAWL